MYAQLATNISLTEHGESPLALHTIYTQCLDDSDKEHREMGITRSFPWYEAANKVVYMLDRGITAGMYDGFSEAKRQNKKVIFRTASTNDSLRLKVNLITDIEVASRFIEDLKQRAIDINESFLENGDITPYFSERIDKIRFIENIKGTKFTS